MFEARLFFGLPITEELQEALDRVHPPLLETFTQDAEQYLVRTTINDRIYLGKTVSKVVEPSHLHLLKEHILSLLRRLLPEYPFKESDFVLICHTV